MNLKLPVNIRKGNAVIHRLSAVLVMQHLNNMVFDNLISEVIYMHLVFW